MKKVQLAVALIGVAIIFAVSAISCSGGTTTTNDVTDIEGVMEDYYDAWSQYDAERVLELLAEDVVEDEGANIIMGVSFAESMGLQVELISVTVTLNGDNAVAHATTRMEDLGTETQTFELIREHGDWKIAGAPD